MKWWFSFFAVFHHVVFSCCVESTQRPVCILTPTVFILQGLLRIHLLEAQNLVAKDNIMMMKGKSDPYVKINIGAVAFKSHVIKENLNPTWNEMYEVWSIHSHT